MNGVNYEGGNHFQNCIRVHIKWKASVLDKGITQLRRLSMKLHMLIKMLT